MNSKRLVIGTHEHHIGSRIVVSLHVFDIGHVKGRSVESDRFILSDSHDESLIDVLDSNPDSQFLPSSGCLRIRTRRYSQECFGKSSEGYCDVDATTDDVRLLQDW
jgi:hypothetical protein